MASDKYYICRCPSKSDRITYKGQEKEICAIVETKSGKYAWVCTPGVDFLNREILFLKFDGENTLVDVDFSEQMQAFDMYMLSDNDNVPFNPEEISLSEAIKRNMKQISSYFNSPATKED